MQCCQMTPKSERLEKIQVANSFCPKVHIFQLSLMIWANLLPVLL